MNKQFSELKSAIADSPDGALFSRDRKHRYLLWRSWGGAHNFLLFIGLNPSVADEQANDPTIRRIIGFAKREKAGGVMVANLFSYCATDPHELFKAKNPVRARNDSVVLAAQALASDTVACWGVHGTHCDQSQKMRPGLGQVYCFGTTKSGAPRHPLYLKADTKLCVMDSS